MTGRTIGKEMEGRPWFLHLMTWQRIGKNRAIAEPMNHDTDKNASRKTTSADVKGW